MTQQKPKKTSMSGFTLIEMIVVIIIIAVLAAIGIPQYLRAVEKSRGAEAVRILGAIKQAEDRYFTRFATHVQVDGSDLTGVNNPLDIEVGTLQYFTIASIGVDDVANPAGTAIAPGVMSDTYTLGIVRNGSEYATLSGFGSANYTVLMTEDGKVESPAPLK